MIRALNLNSPFFVALRSLIIALALTCVAVWLVGEKPMTVLRVLGFSAAGTAENFSYTLFYATPMILTGTAVSIALEAGLFNIGAEGQLYIGALCAAAWGTLTRAGTLSPVLNAFFAMV